jgi:hypothetical protein
VAAAASEGPAEEAVELVGLGGTAEFAAELVAAAAAVEAPTRYPAFPWATGHQEVADKLQTYQQSGKDWDQTHGVGAEGTDNREAFPWEEVAAVVEMGLPEVHTDASSSATQQSISFHLMQNGGAD